MTTPAQTEPDPIWSGIETLRSVLVPVDDLREDPENARIHPESNIEAIKLSLSTYGQMKPVVVHEGVVRAGNGTLRSARALGWTHIAVLEAEHLTREQVIAFGLMDNKASELAEWDFQKVGDLLKNLPENLLLATGFSAEEIQPLMIATWEPPAGNGSQTTAGIITFRATIEQAAIINQAVSQARTMEGGDGPDMSEGRALELICGDFLAGA